MTKRETTTSKQEQQQQRAIKLIAAVANWIFASARVCVRSLFCLCLFALLNIRTSSAAKWDDRCRMPNGARAERVATIVNPQFVLCAPCLLPRSFLCHSSACYQNSTSTSSLALSELSCSSCCFSYSSAYNCCFAETALIAGCCQSWVQSVHYLSGWW